MDCTVVAICKLHNFVTSLDWCLEAIGWIEGSRFTYTISKLLDAFSLSAYMPQHPNHIALAMGQLKNKCWQITQFPHKHTPSFTYP